MNRNGDELTFHRSVAIIFISNKIVLRQKEIYDWAVYRLDDAPTKNVSKGAAKILDRIIVTLVRAEKIADHACIPSNKICDEILLSIVHRVTRAVSLDVMTYFPRFKHVTSVWSVNMRHPVIDPPVV